MVRAKMGKPSLEPIYLNIYDISPINFVLGLFGVGFYHSSLMIFNHEYSYGAHPYDKTGIVCSEPFQHCGFKFRKSILIGYTNYDFYEFENEIQSMGKVWTGLHRVAPGHFPGYINRITKFEALLRCWLPILSKFIPNLQYLCVDEEMQRMGAKNAKNWATWAQSDEYVETRECATG
eukprot:CAMPEP_0115013746 /NCGR_PEP_ID=MMETSP0216-20121206/25616_1 /TAXON_ID=223996 /ORGANISM="Protocruzia adherens, Strain Boccale" /LENGTH=176 /DNA_ID=CAMNT_0002383253 /DNA_START=17 /DNA_END=544 /DNA_ORIENTATION=+